MLNISQNSCTIAKIDQLEEREDTLNPDHLIVDLENTVRRIVEEVDLVKRTLVTDPGLQLQILAVGLQADVEVGAEAEVNVKNKCVSFFTLKLLNINLLLL